MDAEAYTENPTPKAEVIDILSVRKRKVAPLVGGQALKDSRDDEIARMNFNIREAEEVCIFRSTD